MAAVFYIAGYQDVAKKYLNKFSWGHSFLSLNKVSFLSYVPILGHDNSFCCLNHVFKKNSKKPTVVSTHSCYFCKKLFWVDLRKSKFSKNINVFLMPTLAQKYFLYKTCRKTISCNWIGQFHFWRTSRFYFHPQKLKSQPQSRSITTPVQIIFSNPKEIVPFPWFEIVWRCFFRNF